MQRHLAPLVGIAIAIAILAAPVVEAQASTSVAAASYTITPNPIAAPGSLSPTAAVTLTLTARLSSGAADPNAIVWLNVVAWNHNGHWLRYPYATLTVHSTLLNTHYFGRPVYEYRVNSSGQLTMTFTAGNPGRVGGEAGVFAESKGTNLLQVASPSGCQALYHYAP